MALKIYNRAPYYDDFDQTKNYMRILFRPGYSVQARELTQMQTAIQAQIDRFGRHVFKEGSPVIGGLATLDTRFAYVKLESGGSPDPDNFYASLIGTTVTGGTSGITARVLDATPPVGDDPLTIFVKYTSAGDDNVTQFFLAGETLTSNDAESHTVIVAALETNPVGYGTRVSVSEGAYFVAGNFVYNSAESIILEKYTADANARIVYIVHEDTVGSAMDPTLKDNAAGSPNDSAPGADRYSITLELAQQSLDLADRNEANIIQLLLVKHGKVQSAVRTEYSELGDILAKRTYEESGNYTVRPFQINIKEYLNDGTNGGQYTASEIATNITDFGIDANATAYGDRRLAVGLEPSVAYVNGYRIQLEDTAYVPVEKARDEDTLNNQSFAAVYNNYIDVNTVIGLPDIVNFGQLQLRKSDNTLIGSARARSFKRVSGSTYRIYLFDVLLSGGYAYSDIAKVYHSYGALSSGSPILDPFSANVVSLSLGSAPNSMLFRLPVNNVKTVKPGATIETVYDVRIKQSVHATAGSTTLTLVRGGDTFANTSASDWIAINEDDGSLVTISGITTITASSATLTFSGVTTADITVIVPVTRANYTQRTKTYYTNGEKTIAGTPNLVANGYDSLGQTDVLRVKGVYMSSGFGSADFTDAPNIVDRYILDNGQRDNMYDIARLQLKPGAAAPTGRIKVTYDYFTHGSGDYFSVDSYTASFGDYENIPSFQSSLGMVQLRDVLDFRPTRSLVDTDFSSPGAPIDPGSTIMADIVYYMPRIDKIFVNKNGQFGVVKGISSTNPVAPEDPKDAMVLYVLRLGAYTFNAADTIPSMVDNKRYTMRDIGKIEKRVSKLEYYTSLSLLEKDTVGTQIFDGANVRYKNGFVVDSFYGHNVGAITDPDYTVSMDKATGKLRPMFYEDNARLILNSNTNLRQTGSLLTLNYYQTNAIVQPYASTSEYINPYNVFNWTGDLTLSPNTDEWKETKRAPDVVIDQTGIYDTLVSMLDQTGAIGTVWNEWQTNWSGTEQVSDTTTKLYNGNPLISVADISTTITTTTTAQQSRNGVRTSIVPDTVTTDMGDKVVEINFVPFIRSRKIYFKATRLKPNTKMYAFFDGINMADYVRNESGTGNDGFVKYAERTDVENYLNSPNHPNGSTDLITDDTGTLVGSFVIPNTSTLKFKTGPRIFRLTNSSTNKKNPDTNAETQYFAQGVMNTIEHSVVSTRVPQINRTQVNDQKVTVDRSANTTTETYYHWNIPTFTDPTPDPLPPPAPTPTPPEPPVDPIIPDPVIPDWTPPEEVIFPQPGEVTRRIWEDQFGSPYIDPLAQSFMINSPQGAFVTSLDLFFAQKDDEVPVTVQIRVMVNGAPTQTVVPFSQVTMPAVDINVTDTATIPTTFTFESPVYLMQGVEYCFVVLSNSDKHKIYISELGEYDVTQPSFRITKQPYDGVMFKSANASTWTPEQTKDIKFTLRRAAFAQTGTATFVNAPLPAATLSNPIQTTVGSGVVRVLHKNHGHFAGSSKVTFSGIEENGGSGSGTLNGLSISALNTTHTVVAVEIDSYTISIAGSASSTGRAGGISVRATENKTFNVLHPIIQQSIIPATDINWKAKVTSGESLSGQGDPHNVSSYIDIKVNDNTFFNSPQTIVSQPNVSPISLLSGSEPYSIYFQGTLTTALENISPVIDLDRVSVVTVANRIDNPAASATPGVSNAVNNFIEETEPSGGSRLSKYITRKIELNDPATSLHIYTLVNQPTGAGIELFYKTLPNGSDAKFDDLPWIGHASIANAGVSPDNPIPTTDNPNDYTEAQYNILDMAEFSAFAVKITFTAQNSSAVPTCRDFRAIAST